MGQLAGGLEPSSLDTSQVLGGSATLGLRAGHLIPTFVAATSILP